jgi:hypothetical protein
MKKITVYLDKNKYEVEVDETIFDDYKLEACTQIIEKLFSSKNYNVTPFIFCEDTSKDKLKAKVKFGTYNTYKIIINAGYHSMAEKLRVIFFKENNLDLADEPIQSKFK